MNAKTPDIPFWEHVALAFLCWLRRYVPLVLVVLSVATSSAQTLLVPVYEPGLALRALNDSPTAVVIANPGSGPGKGRLESWAKVFAAHYGQLSGWFFDDCPQRLSPEWLDGLAGLEGLEPRHQGPFRPALHRHHPRVPKVFKSLAPRRRGPAVALWGRGARLPSVGAAPVPRAGARASLLLRPQSGRRLAFWSNGIRPAP